MTTPEQQAQLRRGAPGSPPTSGPTTALRPADVSQSNPKSRTDTRGSRMVRPNKKTPRITSLQLKRVDPWTVLKVSLIVSIVMFFVWMIAVGLLYLLFGSLDVIGRINEGWATVTSASSDNETPKDLITPGIVFGVAAVIGAINIVLMTALATIAAFVYNAAAGMAGGVELTLGERD